MATETTGLSEDEAKAVRMALLTHRALGNKRPLLPLMGDADGDGEHDFYGLDENDNVVLVSGVTIEDSVFESDPEEDEESLEEIGTEVPEGETEVPEGPQIPEDPNRGAF